jgi:hypothetical protein
VSREKHAEAEVRMVLVALTAIEMPTGAVDRDEEATVDGLRWHQRDVSHEKRVVRRGLHALTSHGRGACVMCARLQSPAARIPSCTQHHHPLCVWLWKSRPLMLWEFLQHKHSYLKKKSHIAHVARV